MRLKIKELTLEIPRNQWIILVVGLALLLLKLVG